MGAAANPGKRGAGFILPNWRSISADHAQRERRNASREVHQAECERVACQASHDPALGHHLHPGAGVRNGRADDVATERSLSKDRPSAANKTRLLGIHRTDSYAVSDSPAIGLTSRQPMQREVLRNSSSESRQLPNRRALRLLPVAFGCDHELPFHQ